MNFSEFWGFFPYFFTARQVLTTPGFEKKFSMTYAKFVLLWKWFGKSLRRYCPRYFLIIDVTLSGRFFSFKADVALFLALGVKAYHTSLAAELSDVEVKAKWTIGLPVVEVCFD